MRLTIKTISFSLWTILFLSLATHAEATPECFFEVDPCQSGNSFFVLKKIVHSSNEVIVHLEIGDNCSNGSYKGVCSLSGNKINLLVQPTPATIHAECLCVAKARLVMRNFKDGNYTLKGEVKSLVKDRSSRQLMPAETVIKVGFKAGTYLPRWIKDEGYNFSYPEIDESVEPVDVVEARESVCIEKGCDL